MWNIYLYFIILKLFTNFQNMIFLVKIVANASLSILNVIFFKTSTSTSYNALSIVTTMHQREQTIY